MEKIILKNGDVFYQDKIQHLDVVLQGDKILKIEPNTQEQGTIIDIQGQLVTLGFVDMHVHLREPGFEYKETIKSGTRSAMYGGYTHLVAMANTIPCMDEVSVIEDFFSRVKKDSFIHTYTYSAITKGLAGKELVDFKANHQSGVIGFSDDGRGVQASNMMAQAMQEAKKLDSIIVAHCEDEQELQPGACIHQGNYASNHNLVGINSASEYNHAKRDLEMVKQYQNRYHICHISTKETVAALRQSKKELKQVSGEVCPHHIILTDENIKDCHPNYKMNPPLRSKEDLLAIIEGLNDGTLQVIATDHAPHSKEEKNKPIDKAPFGIIGNQHAFSLLNTYIIKKGKVSLETILQCMAHNPARILGLDHTLEVGSKANLCVLDLESDYVITEENIQSASCNTPFLGVKCQGYVTYHILDGKVTKLEEA